jgi:hypothetical protein
MGLESLDPLNGSLGEHLRCLQAVIQAQKESAPVLATVFSPLAQAKNLAGQDVLRDHLRSNPDEVLAGLDRIAFSTVRFVEEARRIGIDGIFYAIQHASTEFFDAAGYARFGLGFDRMILEAAGGMWLNIVHLHGDRLLFDLAREFAAPVVHWHDREVGPDLAEGRRRSGKAVCGGLSRESTILLGDPVRVRAEAEAASTKWAAAEFDPGDRLRRADPRARQPAGGAMAVEARRELWLREGAPMPVCVSDGPPRGIADGSRERDPADRTVPDPLQYHWRRHRRIGSSTCSRDRQRQDRPQPSAAGVSWTLGALCGR